MNNMSRGRRILVVFLVLFVVVLVAAALVKKMGVRGLLGDRPGEAASGFQAVFLTNNQVYFGRLANATAQFPVLRDVYYLQVNRPLDGTLRANDISLVKLGSELHGPIDAMKINRDHILIIEDLKEDSNVVDAIDRFKEEQEA